MRTPVYCEFFKIHQSAASNSREILVLTKKNLMIFFAKQ